MHKHIQRIFGKLRNKYKKKSVERKKKKLRKKLSAMKNEEENLLYCIIAMLIAYSDRLLHLVSVYVVGTILLFLLLLILLLPLLLYGMKRTNKCDLYALHANLTSLLHFKMLEPNL